MEGEGRACLIGAMERKAKGSLIVLIGPSGVGKTTVVELLSDIWPGVITRLVTTTTRPNRPYEVNGRDYHFVSRPEFEQQIADGQLMEYSEYAGNLYGSSLPVLEAMRQEHIAVIAIMDANGAKAVKQLVPEAVTVFLAPSGDELKGRLVKRRSVNWEELMFRLARAKDEIAAAQRGDYDHVVVNVNGRIGKAVGEIMDIAIRTFAKG